MGWDYQEAIPDDRAEFIKRELTWESDERKHTALAVAIVRPGEAYAAIECVEKPNGARSVRALVVLLAEHPGDRWAFGYKLMGEEVLPYYYDAPPAVLDRLTDPPPNEWAAEWRRRCSDPEARRRAEANGHAFESPRTIESRPAAE